jgi:hypothetical protein
VTALPVPELRAVLRAHDEARVIDLAERVLPGAGAFPLTAFGCEWLIELSGEGAGAAEIELRLTLLSGNPPPISFGLLLPMCEWSTDVYVLMPGAVYAGNRFGMRPVPYSPRYPEADARPDAETLVTDIPRLSAEPGAASRIQLLTGDLAAPAFAARWPDGKTVLVTAAAAAPNLLWELAENKERSAAHFALLCPGVRETRYSFGDIRTDFVSSDRGRVLAQSEAITLRLRIEALETPSIVRLHGRVFDITSEWMSDVPPRHELPVSAAAAIVEAKRNREDWAEEIRLYRTTNLAPDQRTNVFQTGWCGGVLAESALLVGVEAESVARAMRSLDTIASRAPRPSGWLAGKCHADGSWTADFVHDAARPWTHRWTLVRRQADALLYLLAAAERYEAAGRGAAPEAWLSAARGVADAFATMWERRGLPGHFIDIDEPATVRVGGSASGALAPAGLLAAWRRFRDPRHFATAVAMGGAYYAAFTARGVTSGGPADAMQVPDSESAAGLVESYLALHEAGAPGGDWLARAGEAAAQLASWVMPYDYAFPPETEFGRLGLPTVGSVFANAQNKHSAPGLCTHSGLSLLHLARHGGDARYLRLLAAIVRFLPWAVSRADRPIRAKDGRALPEGWINERVNTSDWDHNLGGVFYGSTWSEVSLLLSAAELPSVYAQPDTGLLVVLDHLEAEWTDAGRGAIRLRNPTRFPARARLLVETSVVARTRALGPASALGWPLLNLAAGEERVWFLEFPLRASLGCK